jgi:hypothetical protein
MAIEFGVRLKTKIIVAVSCRGGLCVEVRRFYLL